jgi:hypothetical protein
MPSLRKAVFVYENDSLISSLIYGPSFLTSGATSELKVASA